MKKLKCENCGAKIDRQTMCCTYCGTTYIDNTKYDKNEKAETKYSEDAPHTYEEHPYNVNPKNSQQISKEELKDKVAKALLGSEKIGNTLSKAISIIIFCMVAFGFISTIGFNENIGAIFGILSGFVPFIFILIILSVIFGNKGDFSKLKMMQHCLTAIDKNDIDGAYAILSSANTVGRDVAIINAMIIIDYYHYCDKEKVNYLYSTLAENEKSDEIKAIYDMSK